MSDSDVTLDGRKFTQKGDQISCEKIKEDYTPLDFSTNKPDMKLLLEKLEQSLMEFPKAIKASYENGFKDGRDQDYLGCDVMARWESSEAKEALTNENV